MARTSRVKKNGNGQALVPQQGGVGKIYQVGLYVRLSLLDSGKKDSDTIKTQEELLRKFIHGKPCFSLYSLYIDNGETGVNFQRSGFERLMEDVRAGRVDCIVVKDLSRFGRNYIETGEYLENVFPFLGVRFIAVNDHYDSIDPKAADTLSLHLKNLMNDVYARDISAKIGPVLRAKQERGEYIGNWATYGYLKSPEDKHKLIVDEKTAPVVRDIFRWRLEGLSYRAIVRRLMELEILSPNRYRYEAGLVKDKRFASGLWRVETVKAMLASEVYLGHMVQGKKRGSLFQGQRQEVIPSEEWIIVRDTHEALIDQETFDRVQEINRAKRQEYQSRRKLTSADGNGEQILKGLVYCGECGKKLVRYKCVRENKHKEPKLHIWYDYICPNHGDNPALCGFRSVREKTVLEAADHAVREQVRLAGDMGQTTRKFTGRIKAEREREALKDELNQVRKELEKVRRRQETLYDTYAEGLMNGNDYIYAQARYKEKEAELTKKTAEMEELYGSVHVEKPEDNPWLKQTLLYGDKFGEDGGLTREMALALIEKVVVYGKDAIHIEFRFRDEYERLRECLSEEMGVGA